MYYTKVVTINFVVCIVSNDGEKMIIYQIGTRDNIINDIIKIQRLLKGKYYPLLDDLMGKLRVTFYKTLFHSMKLINA